MWLELFAPATTEVFRAPRAVSSLACRRGFYLNADTAGLGSRFPFGGVLFSTRRGPGGALFPATRVTSGSPCDCHRFLRTIGGVPRRERRRRAVPACPPVCHLSLPGFLSLPAWHTGQGEAGKSVVPPGTGFSCSSLCLMSGHDSSLLIKGFLCQANPAEPAGKLLKTRLTPGSRGWGDTGCEFIPEAFRNFCVRGFVQKRIVSDRGLLIIHSERLSPAGPECVCLSARRDAPALRDAPNRDGSSLS